MRFALAPKAVADGFRLEALETIDSTNAYALAQARAGDPGKLWVVSKNQQSGRGRRGRTWHSPPGNLAATLLVVADFELKLASTLGFVAGLALADALDAVAPQAAISVGPDGGSNFAAAGSGAFSSKAAAGNRFELKWPNDVLASGAKLAGILLESTMLDKNHFAVAIGIGINVAAYPDDLPYPATSLHDLGSKCDAETLFEALSEAWAAYARLWNKGQGLAAIRNCWLERAAGIGGEVAVRVDNRVIRGIFETIDEECHFIIREPDGNVIRIAAGDVHFGAVASASAV
ncbi:biotin--[acetyl-CoA-carboxylase] ligase [Aquamicrobium segne]|uniref:biotin--[biotin carboxyl-carrier protein] ligase n=1 Tax=Aquamicrobium segne TaxID=469547 RepID=A0ABW0GVC2_9HYPH